MKKYLSTGLIILLPIALTAWIIAYLLELFSEPLYRITEKLVIWFETNQGWNLTHHETLVMIISRTIALIATFLLILGLGYLGRKFFFNAFLQIGNKIVARIPIVGTIYKLTKDLAKAMFSPDQKTFKQTILIPFPTEETRALVFITSDHIPPQIQEVIQDADLVDFVPTAPHPISGYLLFAPKSAITPVDISSEDAFKFLISCGIIHPKKHDV